jgi:hypothetical protein
LQKNNVIILKNRAYILIKDYTHKKIMTLRKSPSITSYSFDILEDLLLHAIGRGNKFSGKIMDIYNGYFLTIPTHAAT